MKRWAGLPLLLSLALAAQAGDNSVTPEQPVFVPPPPVFIPPSFGGGTFGGEAFGGAQGAQAAEAEELAEAEAAATGARISRQITQAQVFCARVQLPEYQIDCLSDQLSQIAETIPDEPDFAPARQIIRDTSRKLAGVARSKPSTTRRPARLSAGGAAPASSSRPIRPIEREALPQAVEEAEQILEEAETLLLRSAESSERRKVAYEQMAEAIDSTKILLRSS